MATDTDEDDEDGAPLLATHHEYVGVICAVWARLELSVDATIWMLAELNHDAGVGACITAQLQSINHKMSAVVALCRYRKISTKLTKRVTTFHGHIRPIADRRNRIVHDAWVVAPAEAGGDETKQWNWRIGKDVSTMFRPVQISELDNLIEDIKKLEHDFQDIRADLLSEFRTIKEMSKRPNS